MNIPFKYLVLLLFFLQMGSVHSQDLDSMRAEVVTLIGTEKIDLLNEIAYFFPVEGKGEAEHALSLAQKINYKFGIASAYDMLGEHFGFIGDFASSRVNRKKAIELYRKLGHDDLVFSSMIPLIYLDIEERKYFDALRKGLELETLAEELEDSLYLADSYTISARIYSEGMLNLEESMNFLHKAKNIYQENSAKRELVGVYNDLGTGYEEMGKYAEAITNYEKGLLLARELFDSDPKFDRADLPLLLTNMSSVYAHMERYEEAKQFGLEALEKHWLGEYVYYYPIILFNVATPYYYLGDLDSARLYLDMAYQEAVELNSTLDLEQIYSLYKEVCKNENDLEKALEYHELYQQTRDSIYSGKRAANLEFIKAEFELTKIERVNKILNSRLKLIVIIVSLLVLGLLFGLFFYRKLQSKNKTIQAQNIELERLNNTKNRLFAIIAHDFKAPLISFQNLAANIAYLLKKKQPERVQEMGVLIDENVIRLRRQMDNLLNWAMTEMGQMPYRPERFCLNDLAKDGLMSFISFTEEKDIKIRWDIEDDLWVLADKQAIELVVRNILSNALKFTPKNGEIFFSVKKQKPWIVLTIEDTGVGISPEKLTRIFELDNQKSSTGTAGEKGTGLGLAVCKDLMNLNKGRITIDSKIGKGTKVQLYIPTP